MGITGLDMSGDEDKRQVQCSATGADRRKVQGPHLASLGLGTMWEGEGRGKIAKWGSSKGKRREG